MLHCGTILQTLFSASCDTHAGEQRQTETRRHNKSGTCNFSSTHALASILPSQVSSHGALGATPLHAARSRTTQGLTIMPHHPRWSGILPGWPQGTCTAPHPTNGATQHGQLLCWVEQAPLFTRHAAPQTATNQHNQVTHEVDTPLLWVRQKNHSHYRSTPRRLRHKS